LKQSVKGPPAKVMWLDAGGNPLTGSRQRRRASSGPGLPESYKRNAGRGVIPPGVRERFGLYLLRQLAFNAHVESGTARLLSDDATLRH
jgi:hypothetical protein